MSFFKDKFSSCRWRGRVIVSGILSCLLLLGCSRPDPGEVAARAAKQFYDYLLEGKYDAFVDGQYREGEIPQGYREQLITNAQMFVGQQKNKHRGIKEVRVVNAKVDTALHSANVFLVFTYGDSTNEEICVPMLEHEGIWYLR